MEDEMIPKMFWMGNNATQDQWENQEQDDRTLWIGMRYRSYEYEDGGADLVEKKNGGAFWGRKKRLCIHTWMDQDTTDVIYLRSV